MSKSGEPVELEIQDGIACITLARPNEANTIDLALGRAFLAAAHAIDAASDVRSVVLTGRGKHFCLGGDLKAMMDSGSSAQPYLSELTTTLHAGMTLLVRMDAPVIAAVNGMAAGAGFGLVLAADLALAARGAKFVSSYTGVGLTPDAGCTFFLPRLIGGKRALELFLTNRVLSAEEALAWGIVNEVVEEAELGAAARALAVKLAAGPTRAFGAIKRLLGESEGGLEAQLGRESRAIAHRGASAGGREGIAAFLQKRPPQFR